MILSKLSIKVLIQVFHSDKYEMIATSCFGVQFHRNHTALISLKNCNFVFYFSGVAELDRPVPLDDALTCTFSLRRLPLSQSRHYSALSSCSAQSAGRPDFGVHYPGQAWLGTTHRQTETD